MYAVRARPPGESQDPTDYDETEYILIIIGHCGCGAIEFSVAFILSKRYVKAGI